VGGVETFPQISHRGDASFYGFANGDCEPVTERKPFSAIPQWKFGICNDVANFIHSIDSRLLQQHTGDPFDAQPVLLDQSFGTDNKKRRPCITKFLIYLPSELIEHLMDMESVASPMLFVD
jgi:hypothetical protein